MRNKVPKVSLLWGDWSVLWGEGSSDRIDGVSLGIKKEPHSRLFGWADYRVGFHSATSRSCRRWPVR